MFHLLGILFIVLLFFAIIGLGVLGSVLRLLFGRKQHGKQANRQYRQPFTQQQRTTRYSRRSPSADGEPTIIPEEGELHINRKKVFQKDEGEYVDFEEVK